MRKFPEIARKLNDSLSYRIITDILVFIPFPTDLYIIFYTDWFDKPTNKVLYLILVAIDFLILWVVDRKLALKVYREKEAKKIDITKEELNYYLRTNRLIALVGFVVLALMTWGLF